MYKLIDKNELQDNMSKVLNSLIARENVTVGYVEGVTAFYLYLRDLVDGQENIFPQVLSCIKRQLIATSERGLTFSEADLAWIIDMTNLHNKLPEPDVTLRKE